MKSSWVDQETSLMYGGESALQVELKKLAKATWDAVKGIAQMTPVAFLGLPFIPGLMHKAGVSGHIDSFGHQPDLAHPEFSPDASHVQYLDMDRAIDVGVLAPRFGMATDIESGTRVVDEAAISNVKGIFADQMGLTLASNDMAKWHVVEMQFTSEGGRPVDGKNVMHSDSWPQSESNLFAVQNADNPGEMFLLVGSEKGKGVAFDSPMAPNKENSVFVRLSPQVLGENNVAFNYGDQTFMQVAGGGEDQEVNIFVPGEHAPRALKLAMINASEDFVVTPTPPVIVAPTSTMESVVTQTPVRPEQQEFQVAHFINGKGEQVDSFLADSFEGDMKFVAERVQWHSTSEGNFDEQLRQFFDNNPELDAFLAQFEGVPGYEGKEVAYGSAVPNLNDNGQQVRDNYFIMWRGHIEGGILQVYLNKSGEYEAVLYQDESLTLQEFERLIDNDPVMTELNP